MRSCRRRFCTHVASGMISVVLADTAAQSAPAQGAGPAVDAARDPRLTRRVRLRSEGMPVSKVLRGLGAATGVRLDAPGRTGDERLVAFVPGATLAEVMSAISELFRLEWLRTGSDQPSYRLFKSLATHREEALLRERSLQGMLSRLQRVMQGVPVVQLERTQLGQEELVAALPDVLPLISANQRLLLQEGYVYIPVTRLAAPLQQRLTARLQPVIDRHNALSKRIQANLNERRTAEGEPLLSLGGADGPPPPAVQCMLMGEIRLGGTPSVWVGMRDPNSSQYTFLSAEGDDLVDAGRALYPKRELWPRLTPASDGALVRGDLLDRVLDLPRDAKLEATDWMARLRQLAATSGIPIYTDLYSDFENGVDGHPRGRFTLPARTSASDALDALCRASRPGGNRRDPSFWWHRGGAALVRSSRWLWAGESTLPADLVDRLAGAVQRTGHIAPRDLLELAQLSGFQVQGNGFAQGQMDAWTHAVRVPTRLTPRSREQVVTRGLEWGQLTGPEQELLLRLLAPQGAIAAPRYLASLNARPERAPSQGGTLLQTGVEAEWGEIKSSAGLQLPLPGYARTGLPNPQALEVELLQ